MLAPQFAERCEQLVPLLAQAPASTTDGTRASAVALCCCVLEWCAPCSAVLDVELARAMRQALEDTLPQLVASLLIERRRQQPDEMDGDDSAAEIRDEAQEEQLRTSLPFVDLLLLLMLLERWGARVLSLCMALSYSDAQRRSKSEANFRAAAACSHLCALVRASLASRQWRSVGAAVKIVSEEERRRRKK